MVKSVKLMHATRSCWAHNRSEHHPKTSSMRYRLGTSQSMLGMAAQPNAFRRQRPRRQWRQAKNLTHRTERSSVGSASAKSGKRGIVGAHSIALVIRKAVAGMNCIERSHQRIARHLRENGSRRDAGRFGVTLDNCLLRDLYLFQTFCVDQKMLGDGLQPFNRSPHRKEARPVDIYRVDFLDFDKGDTPGRRLFLDFFRESFPRR